MRCQAFAIVLAIILVSSLASVAHGQTTQPDQPTTNPSQPQSADQLLNEMLRAPGDDRSTVLAPQKSTAQLPQGQPGEGVSSPAADAVAPGAAGGAATIREGTDIVDRMGRVLKTSDSLQEQFAFESDGRALHDPPVILLPNLELMLMERAISAANHDLRFRITGTVTEYHGHNYLLLEKFVVIQDKEQQF